MAVVLISSKHFVSEILGFTVIEATTSNIFAISYIERQKLHVCGSIISTWAPTVGHKLLTEAIERKCRKPRKSNIDIEFDTVGTLLSLAIANLTRTRGQD